MLKCRAGVSLASMPRSRNRWRVQEYLRDAGAGSARSTAGAMIAHRAWQSNCALGDEFGSARVVAQMSRRVVFFELRHDQQQTFLLDAGSAQPTSGMNNVPSRAWLSRSSGVSASAARFVSGATHGAWLPAAMADAQARAQFGAAARLGRPSSSGDFRFADALEALLEFGDDRCAPQRCQHQHSAWSAARRV